MSIQTDTFLERLGRLYDAWEAGEGSTFGGVHQLSVMIGKAGDKADEPLRYLKSLALQLWLFGYEIPDALMVFKNAHAEGGRSLVLVSSAKKVAFVEPAFAAASSKGVCAARTVVRARDASDDPAIFSEIAGTLKGGSSAKVGTLARDVSQTKGEGAFAQAWVAYLGSAEGLEVADVTDGVTLAMAVMDDTEVGYLRKSAHLCTSVLRFHLLPRIEDIMDKGRKVTHEALSEECEEVITEPAKIKLKLHPEYVDIAYAPIIQSGGKYDLRPSAESDHGLLASDGAIITTLGTRYRSYCANVSRTYLVNPNDEEREAYGVLCAAHAAAVAACVPGGTLGGVYQAALRAVRDSKMPQLEDKMTPNAGFGTGLEFREPLFLAADGNEQSIRKGMVLNISLGFQGLSLGGRSKPQAMFVADTVIVSELKVKDEEKEAGAPPVVGPQVLTGSVSKDLEEVMYELAEEDSDLEETDANGTVLVDGKRRAGGDEMSRQEQLAQKLQESTAARLRGAGAAGVSGAPVRGDKLEVAYESLGDMRAMAPGDSRILVDEQREALLVPISGVPVPFHIIYIKGVSTQTLEGDKVATMRIMFHPPGNNELGKEFRLAAEQQPLVQGMWLRELTLLCADVAHANNTVQHVKRLQRELKLRETERRDRASLAVQETLRRAEGKPMRLVEVWMRPALAYKGRKVPGTLELHANGMQYVHPRTNEKVHIMFSNIKHAFFQPSKRELITLVHFHLKQPMMVGKKKTTDVQFFIEVAESTSAVGQERHGGYDPDELEDEQRERERKNKINREFERFCRACDKLWSEKFKDLNLEFEVPFRELGFQGVPFKITCTVMPTVYALVELVEGGGSQANPFMVVTLDEVEVVNLERVLLNLKNFDMTIVFKDYNREPIRIDAIPSSSAEPIKEWLTGCNIKFYESRMNLNWRSIMKTINDDIEHFVEEGGWEFLNMEAADSDEDGSEEEESEDYEPEDSEDAEESSEEEDSDDDFEEEEESDGEEEIDSDDSEGRGKTWDELEAEAARADREDMREPRAPVTARGRR